MPLSQGTRLGVYEIVSAVGAGGMGEVYRARDTNAAAAVGIFERARGRIILPRCW